MRRCDWGARGEGGSDQWFERSPAPPYSSCSLDSNPPHPSSGRDRTLPCLLSRYPYPRPNQATTEEKEPHQTNFCEFTGVMLTVLLIFDFFCMLSLSILHLAFPIPLSLPHRSVSDHLIYHTMLSISQPQTPLPRQEDSRRTGHRPLSHSRVGCPSPFCRSRTRSIYLYPILTLRRRTLSQDPRGRIENTSRHCRLHTW